MDSLLPGGSLSGALRTGGWRLPALLAVAASVVAACGGGSKGGTSPVGVPAALDIVTAPPGSVQTRAALGTVVVQVVDGNSDAVAQAGISITAALATGGGTLNGNLGVLTNSAGQASFSNLSIQGTAGNHTIRFTSPNLTSITTGNITLTSGPPAAMTAQAGSGQTALVGTAVPTPPSVKVTDLDGNGISNIPVTFAVTAGGGSISPLTAVNTNSVGVATATSWTLGANPGTNSVSATSVGIPGSPVGFTATGVLTLPSQFSVLVSFLPGTNPDPATQTVFQTAASRWGQVITGDLPDVNVSNLDIGQCVNQPSFVITQSIDDVVIFAEITSIDGGGGVLGSARPCFIRSSQPGLTTIGYMRFDVADTAFLNSQPGGLQAVVLHEMGHVLGFGTLWGGFLNTNTLNPSDPFFQGTNAINSFLNTNGGTNPFMGRTAVPVEATGGTGTALSHWDEVLFGSELMTGFLSGTSQPMSATTIASLKDMGYVVDLSKADAWDVNNPGIRALGPLRLPPIHLVGDVMGGPIGAIGPNGTVMPLRR